MKFSNGVSNYRETPYIISDNYANIGNYVATIKGSVYIARDGGTLSVASIYQADGTSWVAIGTTVTGGGSSSLQTVTGIGNTTNNGIVITANGLSTNSLINTGLTAKSIPFVGTGGLISQDNTNFVWDNTNKWLGIQTNIPTAELDLHSTTTTPMIALNNTAGYASNILFQNNNVSKFRIGNNAANNFVLFNNSLSSTAFFIAGANNNFLLGSTTDDTLNKLQLTGSAKFNGIATSGTSYNFTQTQTTTNATDTGDGCLILVGVLSGTGTTNQDTLRTLTVNNQNSRTGGTVLVNSRAISCTQVSDASTTTTNFDQIYLDYDTALGTATNTRGVTIKRMYGTNQSAFVTCALLATNRSHLFIGGYVLPSGAWSIYSSVTDSSSFLGSLICGTNTDDNTNKLQVTGSAKITLDTTIHTLTVGLGTNSLANNTVLGYQAGSGANSGTGGNVFIGYQNGKANTSGQYNTSLGYQCLLNNTTGILNIGIGYQALNSVSTNGYNIGIGYAALAANGAALNVAIGSESMRLNSSGTFNAALGGLALYGCTTGSNNTALGYSASLNNAGGSNNVSIGYLALQNNTGAQNVSIGASSSYLATTGTANVNVGYQTSGLAITGSSNTIVGHQSNYNNNGGSGNSFLGYQAGLFISGGSINATLVDNSILIGYGTKPLANSQTNQIVIGYNETGLGSNTTILGNASTVTTAIRGNVLLGTTTAVTSSILALSSTTLGFRPPTMTTAQKNAIATPATGLMLFDTTLNKLCVYTGAAWETVTSI